MIGELREASFLVECVACGKKYRPKYFFVGPTKCIPSSDHVCKPSDLKKREAKYLLQEQNASPYCECDDLDCKFEYLEQMKNEMQ
jgi:hypothetical protein